MKNRLIRASVVIFCLWFSQLSVATDSKDTAFTQSALYFDLPAGDLAITLLDYAVQSEISVIVDPKKLKDLNSSPVIGRLTPETALKLLLSKSPYTFEFNKELGSVSIVPAEIKTEVVAEDVKPSEHKPDINTDEHLVVTGIRGSLMRAMDFKYDTIGVADAITEEDIGKFPDSNLAESLQRLSGVTISYSNNEGSKIRVRGFDPNFNMVLLNGRQMPTSDIQDDLVIAGTRSFNFSDLASENISAVEVHKTSLSDQPSGGIGSVINIKTTRPLDYHETKASFGLKAVSDQSNEIGREFTPEFSGLFSTTFNEETLGVLLSFSHQERDSRSESAHMSWFKNAGLIYQDGTTPAEYTGDEIWHPESFELRITDSQQKRTNAQFVFQYRPNEIFSSTVDYTFSNLDVSNTGYSSRNGFRLRLLNDTDITVDENFTITNLTHANGDYGISRFISETENMNGSVGLNLQMTPTDNWTISLDAHSSNSELSPYGAGSEVSIIHQVDNIYSQNFNANFDIPVMSYQLTDEDVNPTSFRDNILIEDIIRNLTGRSEWFTNETDINEIRLDSGWDNEDSQGLLKSFSIGASATTLTNRSTKQAYSNFDPTVFVNDDLSTYNQDPFYRVNPSSYFDQFSGGIRDRPYVYDFDIHAQARVIDDRIVEGFPTRDAAFPNVIVQWQPLRSPSDDPEEDNTIKENTNSAYVQLNLYHNTRYFNTELLLGLRYETTKVENASRFTPPYAVRWFAAEVFFTELRDEKQTFIKKDSYNAVLPSINLRFDFNDSIVARLAYSETMTRPDMDLIRASDNLTSAPHREFGRSGFKGNPGLEPYTSKNYDFGLEWYYGDYNYVALSVFNKKVDGYPVEVFTTEALFDLRDIYNGPRAEAARAELIANGIEPNNQNVFDLLDQGYHDPNDPRGGVLSDENDPLMFWNVTTPVNSDRIDIDGWELSFQQIFGETGFGTVFNYTNIESNANFERSGAGFETPFPSNGDFFNFIGFYDRHGLEIRFAYHWNDEYPTLNSTISGLVPIYTESYGQWDFLMSYTWKEKFTLSLEGINITDEVQRSFNTTENRLVSAEQFGPRYTVGLRYNY